MTLSASEVHHLKQAPPVDGVLPILHQRWSPRSFADREVSPADLAKVFEAARWAASSFNEQPWRFLVGDHNSLTYKKIFDSLMPVNQAWAVHAPVLILGVTKTKFSHNDGPNRVALYDLGAASSYLTLQAAALGLSTHQMAGFDVERARHEFSIPPDHEPVAIAALGYPGSVESLPHKLQQKELAPRQRKPLADFVYERGWGRPAAFKRRV